MLDIFSYGFFQNALIGGTLIGIIASILGTFIVMRKEANVTHSISNFLFLGIACSLFFQADYYIFSILFGLIASLLIFFIEKTKFITKESSKEIISQIGMASALFLLGFIDNLSLDINSYLFGSILAINHIDLVILSILLIIIIILLKIQGKKFTAVILNEDLAKSKNIPVDLYNFIFLCLISLFIAVSIKIFGILLVSAFLVIPSNTGKLLSKTMKGVFQIAAVISVFGVLVGLIGSYYLETSTGASIVLILIIIFLLSIFIKKIKT